MTHVQVSEGRTSGHILSLTERKCRIRHWAGSKGAPIPVPSPAPDPLRPGASHISFPSLHVLVCKMGTVTPLPVRPNGKSSRTRLSYDVTRILVLKNTESLRQPGAPPDQTCFFSSGQLLPASRGRHGPEPPANRRCACVEAMCAPAGPARTTPTPLPPP